MATKADVSSRSKSPSTRKPSSKRAGNKAAAKRKRSPKASPAAKATREICFVISPFGGWHDDYHREIFCSAIKAAGLEPTRADDLFRSSNIVHDIWNLVSTSKVLLADLTGKNPNVFYELGLAHAARKPVLLVTQSMDDVPFDLRALRVITYDVEHPSWGQLLRDNIEQGLQETISAPERSVLPTFLTGTPDGETQVPEDEKRFLDLQQQVDSLRSEMRTSKARGGRGAARITPLEARSRMQVLLADGVSPSTIIELLGREGAPSHWVERELDQMT